MALKFSEMSARRFDLAHSLEAGFDNYKEEIATGYEERVVPLLDDGEKPPDVRLQIELMKRGVARSRERLASFDAPLVEQSHEDAKVRTEIQARQGAVDSRLRQVRHVCRGLYGDEGVARTGLQKEPPEGAARLHEHGRTVKESLENPDLGLKPQIELDLGEDVPPPAVQLAAQLEPDLSALGRLVGERHEETRRGADLRSRRQQALEDFDREVRAIVRTAQGLFRMAGRDDLAARFRPLLRRALRRNRTSEGEGGAETAPPADNGAETPESQG